MVIYTSKLCGQQHHTLIDCQVHNHMSGSNDTTCMKYFHFNQCTQHIARESPENNNNISS